uniref:Protein tyrosine phosphatase receptor type Na n=1 Tax=Oryzias sinensis TaxID=183150 RepID=A0A8C8DRN4_9TELE
LTFEQHWFGGLCVVFFFFYPDGLFGQCQSSKQDLVQYQVSVPVLKRMQEVLKQLMLQGLSWQDDITQSILSKELKRVPHTTLPSKPNASSSSHHLSQYQDEVERSLMAAGGGYARPPSRYQAGQRERDRQLLQQALSLYLASAQPSHRHRGAASMAPAGNKRFSSHLCCTVFAWQRNSKYVRMNVLLSVLDDLLQRMSSVLQRYNIDPRELSQEQLYKLALILQLVVCVGVSDRFLFSSEKSSKFFLLCVCVCVSSVIGPALTFRIRQNEHNMTAAEVAAKAVSEKSFLESETGLKIVQTGVGERTDARGLPQVAKVPQESNGTVITLVSMAVVGGVLVLAIAVACFKHYSHHVANGKLGLGPEGGAETHFDYQELCRQHMASKSSLCRQDCIAGASGGIAGSAIGTGAGGRRGTDTSRVSSVSSQFSDGPQHSPSSTHSSTPSWSEEPAQSNMDISTGHMILAYMEDHLRNKDRLQKEWEALCSYQAEPCSVAVAQTLNNIEKNRHAVALPYDHSRVKLKTEVNPNKQDYINASFIFDHDPRQPSYIATQGPLAHTVADFWQMVWENGCTVIVMMTALVEDGEKQCERYWPDEGSSLYHIYEVNLVSEHIWCKDFLVRSFYLKNVQTQETRTLTQFHLLSWPGDGIPTSTRPLLDFRRKVNKCYKGRSCPIIVHCSDGTSRSGTYILIDMVLNRMAKGVKEIDIAATLEHIRDQRPGLVRTKDQFEFALTAVAEEVNAILKALPQ